MKNAIRVLKDQMKLTPTEFVTFEFKPLPGSFFPDLDLDFMVNGEAWKNYGAQYDGVTWRVTLYGIPKGASIEILKQSNRQPIQARRVNDNNS
jgi:hypothetical protein